ARLPDRLLHGQDRQSGDQGGAGGGGPHAAMGELSGQGLCLAPDVVRRRGDQLGTRPPRRPWPRLWQHRRVAGDELPLAPVHADRAPPGGVRAPVAMRLSQRSQILLRGGVAIALAFVYVPLIVIAIYAFNASAILHWPPTGLTLDWFSKAFHDSGARDALWTS